jgi:hypothetical protein
MDERIFVCLDQIAGELEANLDNPEVIKAIAQDLRQIAASGHDVLRFVGRALEGYAQAKVEAEQRDLAHQRAPKNGH